MKNEYNCCKDCLESLERDGDIYVDQLTYDFGAEQDKCDFCEEFIFCVKVCVIERDDEMELEK